MHAYSDLQMKCMIRSAHKISEVELEITAKRENEHCPSKLAKNVYMIFCVKNKNKHKQSRGEVCRFGGVKNPFNLASIRLSIQKHEF